MMEDDTEVSLGEMKYEGVDRTGLFQREIRQGTF